jgi:hypothetical protein
MLFSLFWFSALAFLLVGCVCFGWCASSGGDLIYFMFGVLFSVCLFPAAVLFVLASCCCFSAAAGFVFQEAVVCLFLWLFAAFAL